MSDSNPKLLSLGIWLSIGSPVIAELASECGFDWLLFDLEHGCITDAEVLANLQAAKREGIKLIVRVGKLDTALIAKLLDWGASGIMLPHVSTPEQAEACVKAMNYPPLGHRGYSSSARVFKYGLDVRTTSAPLFLCQIEDYEGVTNVEEIAAVGGVDVLFVGPADLKLDLSTRNPHQTIPYEEALKKVSSAADFHQKQAGILIRNFSDITVLKQMGFSCLALGSDLGLLREGFMAIKSKFL